MFGTPDGIGDGLERLGDGRRIRLGAASAGRDVPGGDGLLVDRSRHRLGDRGDIGDGLSGVGNHVDGAPGRLLNHRDLLADLLGGLRGLGGERLDLGGDHGEAFARLAGPGRLDGGVEREQVGLRGDVGDQADHRPDLLDRVAQRAHGAVGLIGLRDRLAGHAHAAGGLGVNFADRRGKLLGCRRGHADVR